MTWLGRGRGANARLDAWSLRSQWCFEGLEVGKMRVLGLVGPGMTIGVDKGSDHS